MKKILIADDDLSIRTALSEGLGEEGYEIIAVGSGSEALKIARERELDLLVLDIKMPDMHGIDVLKKLRTKNKTLPVIILTAFPTMEKDMEIQLGNISAFISKPFDLEDVKAQVKKIFAEQEL
ncbi:MAG: response regulator [bacterium]|nr:response regulator [bacterium]